jgi:hypothetical protein
VVIKGMVHAPTDNAAWAAYDRITSAMPGLRVVGVISAQEPTPKSLSVVQDAPPRASKPVERKLTYWLSLRAEYPWKRALTAVTVDITAGAFTHAGTFPAEFTATTTSAGTVILSSSGLTLSAASVPSGTVFDSLDHTVTGPGGEDLYGVIEFGAEWPAVVVGSNTWTPTGTADVDFAYFPTYA